MKKWMIFTLDVIILILFVIIGITGLLIYPGLLQLVGLNITSFPKYYIYEVHHWFGLMMLVLASIHIDMHWKWIKTMTKRVLKRKPLAWEWVEHSRTLPSIFKKEPISI